MFLCEWKEYVLFFDEGKTARAVLAAAALGSVSAYASAVG